MIQRFLPEVKHGDKRIILVDGEFAGAVNRVPAPDDLRSNMVAAAPHRPPSFPTASAKSAQRWPGTARARTVFVGIDVIDGNLTEINVTSPTGIRAIDGSAGRMWRRGSGMRSRRSAGSLRPLPLMLIRKTDRD